MKILYFWLFLLRLSKVEIGWNLEESFSRQVKNTFEFLLSTRYQRTSDRFFDIEQAKTKYLIFVVAWQKHIITKLIDAVLAAAFSLDIFSR